MLDTKKEVFDFFILFKSGAKLQFNSNYAPGEAGSKRKMLYKTLSKALIEKCIQTIDDEIVINGEDISCFWIEKYRCIDNEEIMK